MTAERLDVRSLYDRHAAELMAFATTVVGPTDAADVVSVAFVGALSTDWTKVANHRAYLYRSVLNAARSNARSGQRRSRREAAVHHRDNSPTTTTIPESDHEVWDAVRDLSERQRAVVYLTYWMDLGADTVAEMLDMSTGSVKKHLDRARKTLRTTLATSTGGTR